MKRISNNLQFSAEYRGELAAEAAHLVGEAVRSFGGQLHKPASSDRRPVPGPVLGTPRALGSASAALCDPAASPLSCKECPKVPFGEEEELSWCDVKQDVTWTECLMYVHLPMMLGFNSWRPVMQGHVQKGSFSVIIREFSYREQK